MEKFMFLDRLNKQIRCRKFSKQYNKGICIE